MNDNVWNDDMCMSGTDDIICTYEWHSRYDPYVWMTRCHDMYVWIAMLPWHVCMKDKDYR